MLPSLNQFKKWSLPSKYTAIGLLITILAGVLSVYAYFYPTKVRTAQDTLVEAQHPSEISVEKLKFQNWLKDEEPFLTVYYKNMSDVPIDLLTAKAVTGNNSFHFTPSKTFNIGNGVKIKVGSSLGIPIGMKTEFRTALGLKSTQIILAAGTSPNVPETVITKLRAKYPNQSYFNIKSLPFGVFIKFRGPFMDIYEKLVGVYLYIDAT